MRERERGREGERERDSVPLLLPTSVTPVLAHGLNLVIIFPPSCLLGALANGHLSGSSSRSTASKGGMFTGSSKADRCRRLAPGHDGASESSEEGPARKR